MFCFFDQGDAQVDGGKGVEVDFRGQRLFLQFAIAADRCGGFGGEVFFAGFGHGVNFRRFNTGKQGAERVKGVVIERGGQVGPAQRCDV